jgi:hypothetical protein
MAIPIAPSALHTGKIRDFRIFLKKGWTDGGKGTRQNNFRCRRRDLRN